MVGDWVKDSLDKFGNGKRIFMGINLFSEGACYAARAVANNKLFGDYLFLSEDMVTTAISVNAYLVFVPSLAQTIKSVVTSAFATVSIRKLSNKKINLFIIRK